MAEPTNALAPTPTNALLSKINPMNIYRRNVEAPKRVYGEALLKSAMGRTEVPMTEADFTPEELTSLSQLVNQSYGKKLAQFSRPKEELLKDAALYEQSAISMAAREKADPGIRGSIGLTSKGLAAQAALLKQAANGKLPTDFSFGYEDFRDAPANNVNWRDTLGRFRYKIDPATNTFKVYDTYEFANTAHSEDNAKYAAMNPVQRFKSAMGNFLSGKEAALGEAYLGEKQGVPMNINVPRPR